jgi:galactose mutarotase-like enzyme
MPTASPAAVHARRQELPAAAEQQRQQPARRRQRVRQAQLAGRFGHVRPGGERGAVLCQRRWRGGYPGKLDTKVTYSLDERGNLTIAFEAATDKPTIVNMTNHAIFNLAGEGSPMGAMGHRLTIPASTYTPVGATLIPTGERRKVAGTVFDFRRRRVADGLRDGTDQQIVYGRGYDHNFALDKGATATPQLAARLEDPASGRVLEVLSTEPGVQFYTGNFPRRDARRQEGACLSHGRWHRAGTAEVPGRPTSHRSCPRASIRASPIAT